MKQSRRKFIINSSLASLAAFTVPSFARGEVTKLPKIGVQLYTVRKAMSEDPVAALEQVAGIGYKNLETAGYADGKMYGFTGKEFKRLLDDKGLKNVSGHISLDIFRSSFDEFLEHAVDSGQQYAVVPWLNEEDRLTLDQYRSHAELINQCAEKARDAGIKVCYHNHDFEFQELEGKLPIDVLFQEVDPDLVDFELDLYWISKAGYDPVAFFEKHSKRIPLWHVKDMAATADKGFAPVGTGTIDYGRIFDRADTSGMKYYFVEQDQSDDPFESIKISHNNLTNKILD